MNIGIIGAGSIAKYHIGAYLKNPQCKVKAIADLNKDVANALASEYNIPDVYTDYRELLADESIDAVSIVTPTFTHKNIILDAINAKKHILCEKPPALNAEETKECVEAAEKSGKFFMYALVCRFKDEVQYLKKYIADGKMGKILSADGVRMSALSKFNGWFNSRAKGGGILIDGAIHELDLLLYLMGYPKPKSVLAFSDNSNKDLLNKVKDEINGWKSADKNTYERDIEDFIRGFVTFESGACLSINAASIIRIPADRRYIEINGDTAGARLWADGKNLEINEITEDFVERNFEPEIENIDCYATEINHFIDCCGGKENDTCPPREAIRLMEIIDALYKSADTGLPVMM